MCVSHYNGALSIASHERITYSSGILADLSEWQCSARIWRPSIIREWIIQNSIRSSTTVVLLDLHAVYSANMAMP